MVFWQWGPLIFAAPRMQCTPDGTIIYKNKRCGDGLPVLNGITDQSGGTGEEEGVFLWDEDLPLSV